MDQSVARKTIKGISSQTLITLSLGVVSILTFSIMSRLLTQKDFGYYAAVTAITTVFASFSETGIGASIVQRKSLTKQFVDNAFSLSFIFGLFVMLLLIILSVPLSEMVADKSMKIPLMLMSITLLSNCLTSVNNSIMQRKLQFLRMGAINLVSQIVTSLTAISLAFLGWGYYAILTSAILGSILSFFLSFIGAKTRYSFAIDIKTCRSIFHFSGWLMASVFFRNFAQQADRLLMGNLLSINALGAYNRPKEFINQMSTRVNSIFDSALFPVLSEIQDDGVQIRNSYLKSFYYMNIFAIVFAMCFIFNGEFIIRLFFGENWLNVNLTFQILACSVIFNIDGRLADCFLRSLGWTKQQFYFRIMEVGLQIIGLIIGSNFGINGIASSVVIVNIVAIIVKNTYVSNKIGLSVFDTTTTMLKSWKLAFIIIPVMITSNMLLPHTMLGNIVNFFILLLLLFCLFFLFPSLVGAKYKSEVYAIMRSKISFLF